MGPKMSEMLLRLKGLNSELLTNTFPSKRARAEFFQSNIGDLDTHTDSHLV